MRPIHGFFHVKNLICKEIRTQKIIFLYSSVAYTITKDQEFVKVNFERAKAKQSLKENVKEFLKVKFESVNQVRNMWTILLQFSYITVSNQILTSDY